MYKVERSALVSYSAEKMFDLVNDVDSYSDFLPWCGGSEELSRTNKEVVATVTIAYHGVKKSFTTRNQFADKKKTILSLVEGPFSELSGIWMFESLSEGASKISLSLCFGFDNKLLEGAIAPVFKSIADSMIDSFIVRAGEVYVS